MRFAKIGFIVLFLLSMLFPASMAMAGDKYLSITCHNNTKATWKLVFGEKTYQIGPDSSINEYLGQACSFANPVIRVSYDHGDCSDCPKVRECEISVSGIVPVADIHAFIGSFRYSKKPSIRIYFNPGLHDKVCP